MFYLYILFSENLSQYYISHKQNVELRLIEHNSGKGNFTGKANDWIIVFSQIFETRGEAMLLESKSKKRGTGRFLSNFG